MREPGKPTSSRGASLSHAGFRERAGGWWNHHKQSALDSLGRLADTPAQTLLTSAVVAIALALPALLLIALYNVQALGERWEARPTISIFVSARARPDATEALVKRLQAMPGVEKVEYLSPDQALAQFQAQSGFADVLTLLEENPLPATVIVTPARDADSQDAMAELVERIGGEPLAEQIEVDLLWVERLQGMLQLGRRMAMILAVLLGLGVLLAIGNTIRLAIENRRDEIVVTKLVGATDRYVRRPFLYTGAWYGLLGGLIACLFVSIALASLGSSVFALAGAYQSGFALQGLSLGHALAIIATSVLLGWLGAGLAVSHHLHEIQPQ